MVGRRPLSLVLVVATALTACGGDEPEPAAPPTSDQAVGPTVDGAGVDGGIDVVSPEQAAATIEAAPSDLVVLDVRTPEEFADGHLDGAVMIDFYRDDFAEQVGRLDRDVPYVLYCRSGNRSGQARELMAELGFTSVDDVAGGILAWEAAGLPVVDG